MVENIVVGVMVFLALAGGVMVWWIDNRNNKEDSTEENVHKEVRKKGELRNAKE